MTITRCTYSVFGNSYCGVQRLIYGALLFPAPRSPPLGVQSSQTHDHPEVDGIWVICQRACHGSFKDHLLSTPGWLYIEYVSLRYQEL